MLAKRLTQLKTSLKSHHIDSVFISKKETLLYLTGFAPQHPTEREAFLLLSPHASVLYHSPFIDLPPATKQLVECIPMSAATSLSQLIPSVFGQPSPVTVGIEKNNLTVTEYEHLSTILPQTKFVQIDSIISTQTIIKDLKEQQLLIKAGKIAASVIKQIKRLLQQSSQIGLTEAELAHLIDQKLDQEGADGPAFPTIVAFDAHTANPHHIPDSTPLSSNSIVLIDMGASVNHYKSDLTRTWQLGSKSDPEFSKIKKTVLAAYRQAVVYASSTNPIIANKLDAAARSVITQAGFGLQFIHSTGHGIGLEAHESPHINTTDISPIQINTAFTIEPGIYLPGKFGFRHENSFLLNSSGLVCTTALRLF